MNGGGGTLNRCSLPDYSSIPLTSWSASPAIAAAILGNVSAQERPVHSSLPDLGGTWLRQLQAAAKMQLPTANRPATNAWYCVKPGVPHFVEDLVESKRSWKLPQQVAPMCSPFGFYGIEEYDASDQIVPDKEVEEIVDAIFQELYQGRLSVQELVSTMRNDTQPSGRQNQVYAWMVHVLLAETMHFHAFPPPELDITAVFIGQMLQFNLLPPGNQCKALRCVISALRSPAGTPMSRFGRLALDQFKGRLSAFPGILNELLANNSDRGVAGVDCPPLSLPKSRLNRPTPTDLNDAAHTIGAACSSSGPVRQSPPQCAVVQGKTNQKCDVAPWARPGYQPAWGYSPWLYAQPTAPPPPATCTPASSRPQGASRPRPQSNGEGGGWLASAGPVAGTVVSQPPPGAWTLPADRGLWTNQLGTASKIRPATAPRDVWARASAVNAAGTGPSGWQPTQKTPHRNERGGRAPQSDARRVFPHPRRNPPGSEALMPQDRSAFAVGNRQRPMGKLPRPQNFIILEERTLAFILEEDDLQESVHCCKAPQSYALGDDDQDELLSNPPWGS